MTKTEDNKPAKLTLGTSKLSLNRTLDTNSLKESFIAKRTSGGTAVEVKKILLL